jgi:hypothetical protein
LHARPSVPLALAMHRATIINLSQVVWGLNEELVRQGVVTVAELEEAYAEFG